MIDSREKFIKLLFEIINKELQQDGKKAVSANFSIISLLLEHTKPTQVDSFKEYLNTFNPLIDSILKELNK